MAYTLYLWAKWWGDYDNKYFDYRALAEGLRVQIFWRIAGLRDSVADHYYPGNKEGHIPTRSASEGPMKSSESRRRSPLDD